MISKTHVINANNKIRKTTYIFRQLKDYVSFSNMKIIYSALVVSILNYGISVWGCDYSNNIDALNITQQWITEIILYKPKNYSTTNCILEVRFLA